MAIREGERQPRIWVPDANHSYHRDYIYSNARQDLIHMRPMLDQVLPRILAGEYFMLIADDLHGRTPALVLRKVATGNKNFRNTGSRSNRRGNSEGLERVPSSRHLYKE